MIMPAEEGALGFLFAALHIISQPIARPFLESAAHGSAFSFCFNIWMAGPNREEWLYPGELTMSGHWVVR
jgi:hypothetical protein